VLTGVPADVAAPALKVLVWRDEGLAIALLATINEAKARNLVGEVGPVGAGFSGLVEAVEAITQCESAGHEVLGERTGRFTRVTSGRGTQGFRQRCANGVIHWSPGHGAYATPGDIAHCHESAGGAEGLLGFPVAAVGLGAHPGPGLGLAGSSLRGRPTTVPRLAPTWMSSAAAP
jgi:hypothetical protein